MKAGVVGLKDGKPAIPDHTLIFVGCQTREEAHYICGILNSAPADLLVRGYIALHPSPHVLDNLRIPRFDPKSDEHARIASLSMEAHKAVSSTKDGALEKISRELGKAVAKLFGLSREDLEASRSALEELAPVLDDEEDVEEPEEA